MALTKAHNRMMEGVPYAVNVQDHGAVGDGTTDDTVAIQAAITEAESNQSAVFVPAGTYKITTQLNISHNSVIIGNGSHKGNIGTTPYGAIFDWRGVDGLFQTPGSPIQRVTLKNFTIDVSNNSNANHCGIWMEDGLRHSVLEDIHIAGVNTSTLHGIRLTSASGLGNTSCYFVYLTRITAAGTGGTGSQIFIDGGVVGERYNGVTIEGGSTYGFATGVQIKNSWGTKINNTYFAQNDETSPVGILFSGELNKGHCIYGVNFEQTPFASPGSAIRITNTDNSDSGYAGGTIVAAGLYYYDIDDTVVSDDYRFSLHGVELIGANSMRLDGPLNIKQKGNSGSGATAGTTADDLTIDSDSHGGMSILGPNSNIQQWYAFANAASGQYGGLRGRADNEAVYLYAASNTNLLELTENKSVVLGEQAVLTTNATDGFAYIPTCAGIPSGTPTSVTGKVPMVYDTTNEKIYFYNGSWRGVTVS
jgi:hypothetical protein